MRTDDPWLELHIGLVSHPKTARLRRRLGIGLAQTVGHLTMLWAWAVRYAPTGDLSRYDADVIADASGWDDEPGLFVRALVAAGFLNDDLSLHDWDAYVGRLIDRREANAERMRLSREKLKARRANGTANAHAVPDDARTSGARAAHVQGLPDLNQTKPDQTGPDPTPQTPLRTAKGGEELTELTDDDRQLWTRTIARLTAEMKPGNVDALVAPLVPLGRDGAGGLVVRAPPDQLIGRRVETVLRRALLDAGDDAGSRATIVEGG